MVVLILGVVGVGLRVSQPIELVPEGVEVVISSPGAVFYVGDEFRSQDELVLRPDDSSRWTEADFGLAGASASWTPGEVLPRLFPDSSFDVQGSRSSGLSASGTDSGHHVQGQLQAVGALFLRDGLADDFIFLTLRLPHGGTHDHRQVGRWLIRIGAPGTPRAHLQNPRIEIEFHSSSVEEWLLRRARYSVRFHLETELHPANPRLGPLWIERAEERRSARKDPSPGGQESSSPNESR